MATVPHIMKVLRETDEIISVLANHVSHGLAATESVELFESLHQFKRALEEAETAEFEEMNRG